MMNIEHQKRLREMLRQVGSTEDHERMRQSLESCGPNGGAKAANDVLAGRVDNPQLTLESLDVLRRSAPLEAKHQFQLEAIVLPMFRPVIDIVDDYITLDQVTPQWDHLRNLPKEFIVKRARSVGRLNFSIHIGGCNRPEYHGTGFVVGTNLLMTNRHVALRFSYGRGKRVEFRTGSSPAIDFYHENGRDYSDPIRVTKVLMIHPYWDMALLQVNRLPEGRRPLPLSQTDPMKLLGQQVFTIGYPAPMNGNDDYKNVEKTVFRNRYYIKRFQPGMLHLRTKVTPEGESTDCEIITHDCSTLGGNSGSAVVHIDTGEVVGLHFMGSYLEANYAVSPYDLAQDSQVVDAGVEFVGDKLDPRGDFYGPIWSALESTDKQGTVAPQQLLKAADFAITVASTLGSDSTAHCTIPLRISITVGSPTHSGVPVPPSPTAIPHPSQPDLPSISAFDALVTNGSTPFEGLFFDPSPDLSSADFSSRSLSSVLFDLDAALSLALASNLAYKAEAEILQQARLLGLESPVYISEGSTQCFVASTSDTVMVVFRGTESTGDWLCNFNGSPIRRDYGSLHRGFAEAFEQVRPKLEETLRQFPQMSILLTGHSLGGALATVAAAEWRTRDIIGVYTFGQPAVGERSFAETVQNAHGNHFYRFVNNSDIVTRIPPMYTHVGDLCHFDAHGKFARSRPRLLESQCCDSTSQDLPLTSSEMLSPPDFDQFRAQLLGERAQTFRRAKGKPVTIANEGVLSPISDHSIGAYILKISAKVRGR